MPSIFQRQSLAVMFTDIKGYTSLTSKDEMLALSLVDKKRSILEPLLKKHKGTFVKEMGDGTVTYFNNPAQATDCAIKLQEQTHDDENLNIRIGIHYGDTIIKNKDVFGDTVNIASRIESLAVAGGVFISKEARDKIKKPHDDVSLGLQTMKGVGRLIEIYGLKGKQLSTPDPKDYEENKVSVHSDKEVPSIAILPFENKGKSEDEFYAHGIISDLITDVSSAGKIRVASLKDIEKLEYNKLDNTNLSKQLFVRYIAQGSLWRKGDTFQLSVELYDTKKNRIIWSDNWQENWEELPAIKINLSDGLLKALDTTTQSRKEVGSINIEAYEYYLRGRYKHAKRNNNEDIEIARGLLQKAIELDDNLILAKTRLGWTYSDTGDYDKAMKIYLDSLEKSQEIEDKLGIGTALNGIGIIYFNKGKYDKALDYYSRSFELDQELGDKLGMVADLNSIGSIYYINCDYEKAKNYHVRSLKIAEEINDKYGKAISLKKIGIIYLSTGDYNKSLKYFSDSLKILDELMIKDEMANTLSGAGTVYSYKGDYDKALDYYLRSLELDEELEDKRGMGYDLNYICIAYYLKGNYDKAMNYCISALNIFEKIDDKYGIGYSLFSIGLLHLYGDDYKRARKRLEQSLAIQNEIGLGVDDLIQPTIYLYLSYKYLGKKYDVKEIYRLTKAAKYIEFHSNYALYQLLKDISYLETAYNQVNGKADVMEDEIKIKFLSYPIPRAIVEEYKKLKNN